MSTEAELDATFLKLQEAKNEEALNAELEGIFASQGELIRAAADAHTKKVEGYHGSSLISGVNSVSAENGETAMRDFWLHTMFFTVLEAKYPKVKYAVHGGDLVGGMVQPESLAAARRESPEDAVVDLRQPLVESPRFAVGGRPCPPHSPPAPAVSWLAAASARAAT